MGESRVQRHPPVAPATQEAEGKDRLNPGLQHDLHNKASSCQMFTPKRLCDGQLSVSNFHFCNEPICLFNSASDLFLT
jgi:hypothetical protein